MGVGALTVDKLVQKLNINKIVAEILIDRGIDTEDKLELFLNGTIDDIHDPALIPNIEKVTSTIKECAYFSSITIYSDYDCDGVCSAYIMQSAIRMIAPNADVNIYIANRFKEGYGLSKKAVEKIADSGTELIITLDCGISNNEEIEYARSLGLDVIIIDHHEREDPPDTLFVDLKVNNGLYPFKELCGTGITWKVCQYLTGDKLLDFLDVVAIATIADVVPLVDENRIIVKEGLEKLRRGSINAGIQSIIDVCNIDRSVLSTTDIGFSIGPMINAIGRLDSAYPAFQILIEEDEQERGYIAHELYQANMQRREITKKVLLEIEKDINERDKVIVCQSKAHQGIVGLIAGRISSRYNRPTIVVDGKSRKGSGRSVEPFNLYDNLKACLEEGLLEAAGGHAMAAGITIIPERFESFKIRINELARDIEFIVSDYDKEISLDDIDASLIDDLEILEPCGDGNRRPLFLTRNVCPENIWVLPGGEHIKFTVNNIDAIAFRKAYLEDVLTRGNVDIIYTVGWNEWNGRKSIQMIVEKIKPTGNKSTTHHLAP